MNILHITDFHIRKPKPTETDTHFEALRVNFYEEYLETAFDIIQEKIDYIIVTGDLVDRGLVNNFDHVNAIIINFSKKLNVSEDRIFLTNGNHDTVRDTGDKSEFINMRNHYDKSKVIISSDARYTIYKINDSIGVLSLDSIGSNHKTGLSEGLGTHLSDKIIQEVKSNCFERLFVLSHHPAQSYATQNQAPFDESNPKWSEEHMWPGGGNLLNRLSSTTTVKKAVYWFSGDIHRPEYTIIDQRKHLIVGSSLNSVDGLPPAIPPTINILNICEVEDTSELIQIKREHIGFNNTGIAGNWVRSTFSPSYFGQKIIPNEVVEKEIKLPQEETKEIVKINKNNHSLIDKHTENILYKNVADRGLYHFGKFESPHHSTSLGWVSISGMLNDSSLYLKVINGLKTKVEEIISKKVRKSDCIFLGIDHWGAILAARLGAAMNIRSCCIAVNDENRAYDSLEVLNDELISVVSKKKMIFTISDVISTGYSVNKVANSSLFNSKSNWYAFCIIFDPIQDRGDILSNYSHTYYLCGKISVPVIRKDYLPDEKILKPTSSVLR